MWGGVDVSFTGTELAALKKAAALVGKVVFTGSGPGAGLVDDPIKASRVPVVERRKAASSPTTWSAWLERYPNVGTLTLDDLTPVHSAALAAAPNITGLHLDSAVGIDLAALAKQPHLRGVTFDRAAGVDLGPLAANPRLRVRIADPTGFWSA